MRVRWDEAEESPSGCTSCGCTSWPDSSEATSSLLSSLGARANTRSKHWREETRWRWGEQDTRDSSPLVTPLSFPPRSSTFSISPSLPRQPLVDGAFATLLQMPLHYWSFPSLLLLIFLHVIFQISTVPALRLEALRWTTIAQILYRTNITWHTHLKKSNRKKAAQDMCHKLYTNALNTIMK